MASSSSSPRSRIDQFFPSRKRKPPLVKDEKTEPKSFLDSSPSAKGTLNGYLVQSLDAGSPAARSKQDKGTPPRHDPVKRNLTLEIGSAPETVLKAVNLSNSLEGGVNSVKDEGLGHVRTGSPRSTSGNALEPIEQVPIVPESSDAVESCSGRSELKRFANDFLSLYCSELPSTPSLPPEENLKGHKRNGSPSLLVANDKMGSKKHRLVDQTCSPEMGKVPAHQGGFDLLSSESEASFAYPTEPDGNAGEAGMECDEKGVALAGLRRCNSTPNSMNKTGRCTPVSSVSVFGTNETPKSANRSSMFSPGEEFWNEAIQVVDMLAPADKLSVQVVKGPAGKNKGTPENLYFPGSGKSANKVDVDRSSFDVPPQSDTKLSNSSRNCGESGQLENTSCLKEMEKCAEERNKSSVVSDRNEASPLPVKHFDFLHEGHNFHENVSSKSFAIAVKDIPHIQCGRSERDPQSHGCLQSSDISIHCKVAENKHGSPRLDSSLTEVKCMLPRASSLSSLDLTKAPDKSSAPAMENVTGNKQAGISLLHSKRNISTCEPVAGPSLVGKDAKSCLVASCRNEEVATPSSSMPLKDRLQLHTWLPSEICSIYTRKGISKLYPWQVECLQVEGVLERRNLVYCASTSAGKSFVAEILMLRRVISTGKMAILVLPYVSICAEKAEHLEVLLEPLGKHVCSFYGNQGGGSLPKDTSVAVCTIEKANSLVNRLLEEGRLSEVGIIVIDELHMVGDQHRGYLLELMLTKLRYASGGGTSESSSGDSSGSSTGKTDLAHGLQVVGMSATMPNVSAVADWLQAALYQTDFRPVPLEEYVKVGNTIFNKKLETVRTIAKPADLGGKDPDHIVELCNEIVQEGHSVLLFCSSRKGCESTARHISKFLAKFSVNTREYDSEFSDIFSAIEALQRSPAGLDPVLKETLPSGVAYHHAGLTVEEREIIEACYRKGLVRVLTATSTLAAGVNLPARRVIFRQPRIGRDFIDGTRYRQMAGRAGRTGIDTKGESILICKPEEVKRISTVLNDSCPPLQSCLSDDKNGMIHAILEVVAGGIVQTASDIHRYVRCTLLNSTKPFQDVVKSAQESLRWLCHKKFLEWNEDTKLYNITPLGRAAFGSSLSPEESLVVLDDLSRAREGFVLASDLHLVYLLTPINVEIEPDWELYYERFMELSALDQSVGNRVGVAEPFLMRMAHGAPMHIPDRMNGKKSLHSRMQSCGAATNKKGLLDNQSLRVSKRFYVALMLSRLVQEVPVADVCDAFKVARGMIQSLQENAGRFASMVSLFCERLGWHDLEGLIAKFQNRVSFGVRAEIVELTTIPHVKGSRARALYKAGLRTCLAIAETSIPEIAKALFESSSWAAEEASAMRRVHLGVAKKIKNGARKIVLDKAEEARVAAFSAFKSLGIQVPQFSVTSPTGKVGTSVMQVDSVISHTEDSKLCLENEKVKELQFSLNSAAEDSKEVKKDNSQEKTDIPKNTSVQASSFESSRHEPSASVPAALVEISPQSCDPPVKSIENRMENSAAVCYPELVNEGNGLLVGEPKCGETQEDEANLSINNSGISDKSPINAGSVAGGFDSFLNQWEAMDEFYFDVHFNKRTNSNSPVVFEIFGLAICWKDSPVHYINLSKDLLPSKSNTRRDITQNSADHKTEVASQSSLWDVAGHRWKRITKIMGQSGVRKITWNLKSQIQALKNPGISVQRFGGLRYEKKEQNDFRLIDNTQLLLPPISVHDEIDMCLVVWILWPDEESCSCPNLEKVVKKHLSPEASAAATRDGRWRNQMRKAAYNGCCRRVSQTRALDFVLWRLLVSENLVEALIRIEMPLVKVLADMELWGIGVDMEACLRARHVLGKKLKELEKEAFKLAGLSFSLYSTADIANVLYTQLKLPLPEGCDKGKQHPSTDKHSLDLLRGHHPIIHVIKEHRTLAKLLNSTLGSICSKAQLCLQSQKYIVKGHWIQTSTATGRLSMEEPNLQCVEHMIEFTSPNLGKNEPNSSEFDRHQINARDFFIPTQDNWILLAADYSQIELRLMAHFSQDTSLIELLSKPDGDVFTMLAARWTGKLECTISSPEREQTKRLVYGILYGMGANTLAEQLGCSSEEAAEKIRSFKSSFSGVSSWLQEAVAFCHRKGYVETLMGRKRFLSKIKFGNSKEKSKAQRQAVNSICQGSAADIIKIAMLNIYAVVAEECELPTTGTGFGALYSSLKGHCRIPLQVHDELLLEVDPSLVREAGLLLQVSMETAASLLVPLRVKLKVGRTWGSLEPFDPKS